MDHHSSKSSPIAFKEAVLKAKVMQIADSIGYNSITQDSSNILVDIYRRTILHLARHCKDAANNNRRVESTMADLVQAFNFIGINIPELKEHIETVKLPLNLELTQGGDQRPLNRIQRNLLVDDLLEAEKKGQQGDQEDGDNKAVSESGLEEDDKPIVPLLKDTYSEIAGKFTDCQPVTADKKIRIGGRIVLVASTKLKINTPIPPESAAPSSSSLFPTSEDKLQESTPEGGKVKKSRKKQAERKMQAKPAKGKRKKRSAANQPADDSKTTKAKKETPSSQEKAKRGQGRKKVKVEVTPLDPSIAEPPSFLQILETKPEEDEIPEVVEEPKTSRQPTPSLPPKQSKGKRKKRSSAEFAIETETVTPKKAIEEKTKGRGRKKLKTPITPLDPSIAEPPSFFPILETKVEVAPDVEEPKTSRQPTPTVPIKQTKGKKRKKSSSNQFAIVTETVTATAAAAASDDKEWLCPACGGPDDGDLMVECDSCKEWYHLGCTSLSKPPEDDENWECDICIDRAKAASAQKRSQTPVEPTKLKIPEPVVVKTTPPPPTPAPPAAPPAAIAGSSTSQDDLCPECNLPDDGTMMIQCDDPFCAKWFHGKCVNLLEEPKEDESWFCKACVEKQQSAFKRRRRAK